MRRNRKSFVLAASVAGGLALPGGPAVPATSHSGLKVDLSYEVYFGGAHVAGMAIDVGLDPGVYDMKMQLETVGWIGRLFPWSMKAYSRRSFGRKAIAQLNTVPGTGPS